MTRLTHLLAHLSRPRPYVTAHLSPPSVRADGGRVCPFCVTDCGWSA